MKKDKITEITSSPQATNKSLILTAFTGGGGIKSRPHRESALNRFIWRFRGYIYTACQPLNFSCSNNSNFYLTENNFSTTNLNFKTIVGNFSTIENYFPATEKMFSTTAGNFPTMEKMFSTMGGNFTAIENNFSTSAGKFNTTEEFLFINKTY